MNKSIRTLVIAPGGYGVTNKKFPVVYLLHGYAGRETDWIKLVPSIKQLANSYGFIIVCADAENSWYLNSPSNAASRYQTFMTEELINAIDSSYHTIPEASGRAITGLSMGGHGALMLSIKNQHIYGAAGSMSGGLNLRPFMKQFELGKVIADTTGKQFKWADYSVLQMLDSVKIKGLKIMIDCGVDDFFFEANQAVHQKLLQQKIPHDYIERPGNHSWQYWSNAVDYQFVFFKNYFSGKN